MFDSKTYYGILGLARSGIAAAYKIKEFGGKAFLSEKRAQECIPQARELMRDFDCEFGGHSSRLFECDQWIVSPGIPLSIPIIEEGMTRGIGMISEIEFGYQIKHPDSKVIAVTGSNGKSTTASLIHHLLQELGQQSLLAGNIGDALCSFPIHKPGIDYIVLEISSFQLDLIQSFAPEVAVLLNLTPDHLNRYTDFPAYCESKMKVFSNQSARDYAVLYKDSAQIAERAGQIPSQKLWFSGMDVNAEAYLDGKFICVQDARLSIYALMLKGLHNHLNVMAALLAVSAVGMDIQDAIEAAQSFRSLPHRLEYVESISGVAFYNDSKATNTDSTRSALESFDKRIRIILGGSDKGEDFSLLTDALQEYAVKAYVIGDTKDQMRQAWLGKVPLEIFEDFSDCVHKAFEDASMGEYVVLSPACASFDRFQNFEERGNTFKQVVLELKREKEQA